jgi:hypothetical protein
MTSLFFGQLSSIGVPADEKVVRATAVPVDHNAPPAMQNDMPEMSEVETDQNPTLGMVNRQKASKWIDRFRSTPEWITEVDNGPNHNYIIDSQVSSSGYSAGQEAQGKWGHGTMPAAIGIEPVGDLRDGGKMGNEYFVTNERDIQDTASSTMMTVPPGYDHSIEGRVSATGKDAARRSAMAGMYDTFWNGGK